MAKDSNALLLLFGEVINAKRNLAQLIQEVNRKQLWNMTYMLIFIVMQEDKVTIFTRMTVPKLRECFYKSFPFRFQAHHN